MRWFLNKQRSIGCKNCFTPPVKRKSTLRYFFLRWLLCRPVYRKNSFWDQLEIKSSTQNSCKRDQRNERGVDAHVLLAMILAPWQSLHMLHRLIVAILRTSFKRDTCCVSSHWAFIHLEHGKSQCLRVVPWILMLLVAWRIAPWSVSATSLGWFTGTPNSQVFAIYMYWQFFSEMMRSFLSEQHKRSNVFYMHKFCLNCTMSISPCAHCT